MDCHAQRQDLQRTHDIQTRQLEDYLEQLPKPHVKYSSQLLELKNSQHNLSKLNMFEEAKSVYTKVESMEKQARAESAVVYI
jgi:hypothetical protein